MVIPESTNATFTVRTYNGEFSSNLQTKAVGEIRRGRRATYSLGNGGAEVELESFGGSIRLRRPGTVAPPRGKDKDHEKPEERLESDDHSARSATIGSTWAARIAGAAAAATAVNASSAAIVTKVTGSHGCTRNSIPATS